uniref:BCL2-like 1 n=1 Tax=Pan troglodytes TaxID=9598 RepID=K7C005_PANTR
MTILRDQLGPRQMPQSCLWPQLPHFLQEQPVASLPWAAPHGGFRGLSPEVKGSYQEQLWEPQGLPYLRQEGQEGEPAAWGGVGLTRRASPAWPGRSVPHACPAWAARLPRPEWPGQELFRPPSLFCSTLGLSHPQGSQPPRALCCTYLRLVFIPCEDDILFLLSVSVFMCEELLACSARAHGELVPGDWTA